jgi:sugar/nucleoside kinase (ribokinase family)
MRDLVPIDYLLIGHITQDLDPDGGFTPGGTVAYAALTAAALGDRPGIVTSIGPGAELGPLRGVPCAAAASRDSSVFDNVYGPAGRVQRLVSAAAPIDPSTIPQAWRGARVVHLGPVANEVDPSIFDHPAIAAARFVGVTPQGWMRRWDAAGVVSRQPWAGYARLSGAVDAVVFSEDDVESDEGVIRELAGAFPVTAVTRGRRGARVFVRGDAPFDVPVRERHDVDPTGAGDVFSAVFFSLLSRGVAPRRAAAAAAELAASSVEHPGLAGVPGRALASAVVAATCADEAQGPAARPSSPDRS